MPSANVNFCSHCGSSLDADVNYCPQCGTRCRTSTPEEAGPSDAATARRETAGQDTAGSTDTTGTTTDASGTETARDDGAVDHEAFRRRVGDHLVDGWTVESDRGDRVLLRKPEYGSVGVHVLLLLFTGGLGNLAYGWYKYTHDGERRILRANGDDTYGVPSEATSSSESSGSSDASASALLGYVGGAFSLLLAVVLLSSFDPIIMVLGAFFLVAALWMIPATRRRWRNRHPPTTFGHVRSTDETVRVDPDRPCVVCSGTVDEGVERSYREEYVFAGISLFRTASGENQYCRSCASGDLSEYVAADPSDRERVADTDL